VKNEQLLAASKPQLALVVVEAVEVVVEAVEVVVEAV
jgi:hypothetical protein